KEVAVVGVPGPYGGEAIIPYEALTEADVLSFCRERLTDYKIPRFVVFREALPRSPLGKLLRKHLIEEPDDASSDGASKSLVEKVGRGTAVRIRKTLRHMESLVCATWKEEHMGRRVSLSDSKTCH